jgi:putative endonuclease
MAYYVYILQSELDESFYIGSTQNLDERMQRHNQGRFVYTKAKRPWKLVYFEKYPDRSSVVERENQIK